MNRATLSLVGGLLFMLPSPTVFGAIIPRVTLVASPPSTPFLVPEAALPAPWQSYELSLLATAGEFIGAVDVRIDGPLHQRWRDIDFDGVVDPTPTGSPANRRGDSHLTAPAGSPFGAGPTETNSRSGSPLPSIPGMIEYGLGPLNGAWAILNPQPVTNLAYLVVRSDQTTQVAITVKSADPTGRPYPEFRAFGFDPIIPEPATTTMIAFAILGVAAARIRPQARKLNPTSRVSLLLAAGLLVVLPTSTIFGAIIPRAALVANPPTTPFLVPDTALPAPWQSYQLSLQATAGETIGAVEVIINGPLHQRWVQLDFDEPVDPTPLGSTANRRGDSHLTAVPGSPFGAGPSETNSKSGSPLTSIPGDLEYGLGGVYGAWGILSPQPVTNLAYIVVRKDRIYEMDISVIGADPTGQPFRTFRTIDFFPIPEPATITMIAFAMLGVAALRVRTR